MRLPALSTILGLYFGLGMILPTCNADMITVMIGDDDGFGGTQGPNSNPGEAFFNFASPFILPGTYTNLAALDATTDGPYSPYVFQFSFAYNATSLASITTATVTIQSGSLARRTDNSGFGFASVSADGGSGSTSLGDFWTTSTGVSGSQSEESVKAHAFDVSALITPASTGSLILTVDGSALQDPFDRFALDFAELQINGPAIEAVPEPSSCALLGVSGIGMLVSAVRRRRKVAD